MACDSQARTQREAPGILTAYHWYSQLYPQRQCRLQPTCSLYFEQASERRGFFAGVLLGLARLQMEHSDQGGYLQPLVASDGLLIYLDEL